MSSDRHVVRYFDMTVTFPLLLSTRVESPKQSPSLSSFNLIWVRISSYQFGDHDLFTFLLVAEVALAAASEDHVELAADGAFEKYDLLGGEFFTLCFVC